MAEMDSDALQRQIEQEIAEKQRELKVIRDYRELMEKRNATPQPAGTPAAPGRGAAKSARIKRPGPTGGFIAMVRTVLVDEWHPVKFYLNRARGSRPTATRAAVATALRRLAEYGYAERKEENERLEYRKPQKNETP
jgi:hypothetical protein